jgi:cytochrome b
MSALAPVRVWDGATRLFHWLLLALVCFSWGSAEYGKMDWHRLSGSLLLGLLAFRLIWGFIGGSTARFGNFLASPMRVLAYLRGDSGTARKPGHNPVGGYSVLAMLLLLAVQIGTGLFAVDIDGLESGPLSHLVSFDQGREASGIHELSFTLLQIVVAIHVVAVLFYLLVRKRNLITPMITGSDKQLEPAQGALAPASWARLAVAFVISAGLAWWTAKGMPY